MADVVQMWSGGKDSTCAGIKHIERGDNVHFICYVPMFDKDIPLIGKEHFSFLNYMKDLLISMGAKVDFVHGITYWEYCTRILVRGERKGCMQSYPCFLKGKCGFNRDSKTLACNDLLKKIDYDFVDIALCADELGRKVLEGKEISILQEIGYKKRDAFNFCLRDPRNILSPVYKQKKRDGCLLCPHALAVERHKLFNDYAEFGAFERLLDLQRILKEDCQKNDSKEFFPLRSKHYFIENAEFVSPLGSRICMFGDTIN